MDRLTDHIVKTAGPSQVQAAEMFEDLKGGPEKTAMAPFGRGDGLLRWVHEFQFCGEPGLYRKAIKLAKEYTAASAKQEAIYESRGPYDANRRKAEREGRKVLSRLEQRAFALQHQLLKAREKVDYSGPKAVAIGETKKGKWKMPKVKLSGVLKTAKRDMPSFTAQDRPKKVKEIYRALKRDHPTMPAEMKARIAARQGKPGKQKQGPPYKAPIKPWRPGKKKAASALEKIAAVMSYEGLRKASYLSPMGVGGHEWLEGFEGTPQYAEALELSKEKENLGQKRSQMWKDDDESWNRFSKERDLVNRLQDKLRQKENVYSAARRKKNEALRKRLDQQEKDLCKKMHNLRMKMLDHKIAREKSKKKAAAPKWLLPASLIGGGAAVGGAAGALRARGKARRGEYASEAIGKATGAAARRGGMKMMFAAPKKGKEKEIAKKYPRLAKALEEKGKVPYGPMFSMAHMTKKEKQRVVDALKAIKEPGKATAYGALWGALGGAAGGAAALKGLGRLKKLPKFQFSKTKKGAVGGGLLKALRFGRVGKITQEGLMAKLFGPRVAVSPRMQMKGMAPTVSLAKLKRMFGEGVRTKGGKVYIHRGMRRRWLKPKGGTVPLRSRKGKKLMAGGVKDIKQKARGLVTKPIGWAMRNPIPAAALGVGGYYGYKHLKGRQAPQGAIYAM